MKRFFAILEYLFIVGISVLFMLFLDGPGGSYLIIALVSAAVISILLAVITRRSINAEISVSEDILNKGDNISLFVNIHKTGFLPTTFIELSLFSGFRLKTDMPESTRIIIFGKDKTAFKVDYRAEIFGKCMVGLKSLRVTDFFGLVSFDIPINNKMRSVIRIYPDIPNVGSRDGLARSLADSAAFEESEETSASVFSTGGTPGYEHRKYEPGDNLRLINWKLSAKRGELLVRRTEGASCSGQAFVLYTNTVSADKIRQDDLKAIAAREELAVEAMLGLAVQFIKSELPARIFIRFSNVWEDFSIVDLQGISDLCYRLTEYVFSAEGQKLPVPFPDESAVIFSAFTDESLLSFVAENEKVCAAAVSETVLGKDFWRIEKDNSDIRFMN